MTFENALQFVFDVEDIHSNDPQDPGGDTWFGLSRRAFPNLPWPPTREQAAACYRENYWDACKCDNFPWEVGLLLFDTAVNQGPGTAVSWLQHALGLKADGIVGPQTIKAGWAATPEQLADVLVSRAIEYAHDRNLDHDGRGWYRRLFRLHTEMRNA